MKQGVKISILSVLVLTLLLIFNNYTIHQPGARNKGQAIELNKLYEGDDMLAENPDFFPGSLQHITFKNGRFMWHLSGNSNSPQVLQYKNEQIIPLFFDLPPPELC